MLMIKNIVQCLKCKRNRYKVIYKTTITFSLALDFTQHNSVLLTLHMYIFTLQNILAPPFLEGLLGEQYTLMDFLSRENSRVNSFFHIC